MDLTVFIAVTAAAVVIQAAILVAMFVTLRKTSARVESLTEEIRVKALPAAVAAHSLLVDLRPKLETTVSNVSEATSLIRAQLERVDVTVNDVIDRTRLQIIRTDDLLSRTLDRVEETTEMVHDTVVSPVRKLAGVIQGLTAGLEYLAGAKRRRGSNGVAGPQDEMFI